jgi:hypothetical protein
VGNLQPNREVELRWFSFDEIPYEEMWDDDRIWLSLILKEKSFVGDFYFTDDYKQLLDHFLELTYHL